MEVKRVQPLYLRGTFKFWQSKVLCDYALNNSSKYGDDSRCMFITPEMNTLNNDLILEVKLVKDNVIYASLVLCSGPMI